MFSSFVDFMIPNNRFSKYIRLVLGTIVMITILNPIITIFHKENFIDSFELKGIQPSDESKIISKAESFSQKNNEIMMKNLKRNISTVMKEQIKAITPLEVVDVKIQLNEDLDSVDFSKIEHIFIVLSDSENPSLKDIKVKVKNVEDKDKDILTQTENRRLEIKKIKDYLKLQFDVSPENIHVNLEG